MDNCESCGGKKWFSHIDKKTGLQRKHHITLADGTEYDLRIWRCWRCGHVQEDTAPFIPLGYRTAANILYIDLEVSKSRVYSYGLRVPSGFLNPEDLDHEYYIICWVASYVGSDKLYYGCVNQEQALNWNDAEILQPLRDLMDPADIVAGHNVDAYDMKRANTRTSCAHVARATSGFLTCRAEGLRQVADLQPSAATGSGPLDPSADVAILNRGHPAISLRSSLAEDAKFIYRVNEETMRVRVEATWGRWSPERVEQESREDSGSANFRDIPFTGSLPQLEPRSEVELDVG